MYYHLTEGDEVMRLKKQWLESLRGAVIDGLRAVVHGIVSVIKWPWKLLHTLKNRFTTSQIKVVHIDMPVPENRLNALERRVDVIERQIDTLEVEEKKNNKQLWLKIKQLQKQVEVGELERAKLWKRFEANKLKTAQLEERNNQDEPQASQAANDTTANETASEHLSQSLDANADALIAPMTAQFFHPHTQGRENTPCPSQSSEKDYAPQSSI